ncbi:MAG: hypothetical protein BroJett031_35730 [Betaproteobacteria bacterium]|jgi:hypothetical protein|nr:MAG: hypothetical protein BroJett031_35730 [Betaproteobacteria bacterium]
MNAADILRQAAAEGVEVRLAPDGRNLRVRCEAAAVERWQRTVVAHNPALLAALATPAEAEKLAARAHRELGWRDADVRDFLDVRFAQHPHAALVALAELLDFVQRERQRTAGGLTRGA